MCLVNIKQLPLVQYERDKELIVKLIFTTRSVRNLVFYVIGFNVFARSVDGGKLKLSVCILSNITCLMSSLATRNCICIGIFS